MLIYGLKGKNENEIRYIGLTTGTLSHRLRRHLSDKKIDHKTNWIKEIGKNNIEIIVIEDNIPDIAILHGKEIFYIDKYKKEGHRLTNITNGGEGWYNMEFSQKHKENIKLNHANVKGENNPMYGKKHTDETKDKIRKLRLEHKISNETREKFRSKRKGENNNNAKLKSDDVLKIREYYKKGEYSQNDLGKMFKVNQPAIYKIVNHITWKHI